MNSRDARLALVRKAIVTVDGVIELPAAIIHRDGNPTRVRIGQMTGHIVCEFCRPGRHPEFQVNGQNGETATRYAKEIQGVES